MSRFPRIACDVSEGPDLRTAFEQARRGGFEGITVSARQLKPRELSQTGRREVRRLLASHDLAGTAVRFELPDRGLTPGFDVDWFLDRLQLCLQVTRDCGFALLACDLGAIPRAPVTAAPRPPIDPAALGPLVLPEMPATPGPPPPAPLTEAERQHAMMAAQALQFAGAIADQVTVPVAFGAGLAATADLVHLLEAVDCPLFGRELDPGSAVEEGPASLVAMMPPILHVQGTDAQAGGGKFRPVPPGEGDANWPELLAALRDADYRGFVSLPGPPEAASAYVARFA